ncbi:MAG: 16S rRNA (guanine(527)-N(7))-methyltransferase RsmG [Myxococcota bacterium]
MANSLTGVASSLILSIMTFEEALKTALHDYRDSLDDRALQRLATHWSMVERWGERLNLTAIRDPERAAWVHYRDSIEPLRVTRNGPWADMGSGAGFPGLPMAILHPQTSVTLIEPRRKRASFLRAVVAELELPNVRVLEARSNEPAPSLFGAVVTRATFSNAADLKQLLEWCEPGGQVIALRSEPTGALGSRVYSYDVLHERRIMEVWVRPTLAAGRGLPNPPS